jgi:hypothetical protein
MLELAGKIEAATGLSRTRLAELLYEWGGFVDHQHCQHAPDRDVPEWIDSEIAANIHCGDCTKVPAPCMRCHADIALGQWDELIGMIVRARHHLENSDAQG